MAAKARLEILIISTTPLVSMLHRTCAVSLPLHCDHVQRLPGFLNSVMAAKFAVYEDLMHIALRVWRGSTCDLRVLITRNAWVPQHMSHFLANLSDAMQNRPIYSARGQNLTLIPEPIMLCIFLHMRRKLSSHPPPRWLAACSIASNGQCRTRNGSRIHV
jgi:hypothetical protein